MAEVAVTVLATTPEEFKERIDRLAAFAKRVHLDVSDGVFSPTKTISPAQLYAPEGARVDIHVMLTRPEGQFETFLSHNPSLIIFHAESEGDILSLMRQVKEAGIAAGIALKQETATAEARHLIEEADHVLVFTGQLGFNGGEFDGAQLDKISEVKSINPRLEVSVDGGMNIDNARIALDAGADVICTGSFVHNSTDPEAAYSMLESAVAGETV